MAPVGEQLPRRGLVAGRPLYTKMSIITTMTERLLKRTLGSSIPVLILVQQPPADQRIVHERLQHCHERLLVITEHPHANLARIPEAAFDAANLQ